MKRGFITVLKKELARFFGDKRMAIATILLPGVLIYILYSFMGSAISGRFTSDVYVLPTVTVINMPESVAPALEEALTLDTDYSAEEAKAAVSDQSLDALVIFPENFDALIAESDPAAEVPNVEVYHNSLSADSMNAYDTVTLILDSYEDSLNNRFDINGGYNWSMDPSDAPAEDPYDLISDEAETGSFFSMMLPMLLMIFLFSGCMAIAPESIAGEKERGTIATMLITPVGRSEIALGKIVSLSLIALLSATCSAIGTILSLPKMMAGATDSISGSVYGVQEYLLLAAVILSTVLVIITLISLVSAFAKTVKEAQTMITPLMILVMFLGVTAMFGSGAGSSPAIYFIPLYNSVQCMTGIFSFDINVLNIIIGVGSNLVYTALGIWGLTKMFKSERIIFSK